MSKAIMGIINSLLENKNTMKTLAEGFNSGMKKASHGTELTKLLSGADGVKNINSESFIKESLVHPENFLKEFLGVDIKGSAQKVKRTAVGAGTFNTETIAVSNEAYRVTTRAVSPVEAKIAKITELMQGEKEAYRARNLAFVKKQQSHINKFQTYLDGYASKHAELVEQLDAAKTVDEAKTIAKKINDLGQRAEKILEERLKKLGTLSEAKGEIAAKIQEARQYVQARTQNRTFACATTEGAKVKAEKFIADVAKEFHLGQRNITPEQLKIMLKSRLQKIEKLAAKAELEEKTTIKRTINFGGMQMPVEIPVMGTSATEEIARICGGKNPKEALEYYRTLGIKIDEACAKLSSAAASDRAGFVQLSVPKVEIPIKQAEKPQKLQWFEKQLAEKRAALKAEKY